MDLQLRFLSTKNKGRKNRSKIKKWSEKYFYRGKGTLAVLKMPRECLFALVIKVG